MTAAPHLTPDLLLRAYGLGVFPMAESADTPEIGWYDPARRGVLPLDGFHVPRRLLRTVRQNRFDIAINQDFPSVIAACAQARPGREETWINDEIQEVYVALHRLGHAHSVECRLDGVLVGGLYGVALGSAFFGESMFSTATDASKVALVHLVARLRAGRFTLLDTQFITEHLAQFGAVEIPRGRYHMMLRAATVRTGHFTDCGDQQTVMARFLAERAAGQA